MDLPAQNNLLKIVVVLLAAMVALLVFWRPSGHFNELTAARINIVDADGQLRLAITNKDRLPSPKIDGQSIASQRQQQAGLIFFNEHGDEAGGLTWNGNADQAGNVLAGVHLAMDRFRGDQQLSLGHYEHDHVLYTGLRVYDSDRFDLAPPLPTAAPVQASGAHKPVPGADSSASAPAAVERAFLGKTAGKSSALILSDAAGRPRIMLLVGAEGNTSLDFLDEQGHIIKRLAPQPDR